MNFDVTSIERRARIIYTIEAEDADAARAGVERYVASLGREAEIVKVSRSHVLLRAKGDALDVFTTDGWARVE